MSTTPTVTIVGAGLAGSLMAAFLGRRGFEVQVYERRGDPHTTVDPEARSINLGLSERGLRVLDEIGVLDKVAGVTVPMRGRAVHKAGEAPSFHAYGTKMSEILHSVLRRDLNLALIDHAAQFPTVRFTYDTRFTGLDSRTGTATFVRDPDGEELRVSADALIGADGVFSAVRGELHRGRTAELRQDYLDWGYKQLTIPTASQHPMFEAFHVLPAADSMVVAQPNPDGSLTGTLFLPLLGEASFATLGSPESVERFFRERFPYLLEVIPDLVGEFHDNPVGSLITVRTGPWHTDRAVLLGDACHAVYPFYGQGMNAAFEDCRTLDECLGRFPGDWAAAFAEYERLRKPQTDVLADLSEQHFAELRDSLRSPLFLLRRRVQTLLGARFPSAWQPLHAMVSHTTMPYAEALRRHRNQERALRVFGAGAVIALAGTVRALWRGFRAR